MVIASALLSGLVAVPASWALDTTAHEMPGARLAQYAGPVGPAAPFVVLGDADPELRADILAAGVATSRYLHGGSAVDVDVFANVDDAAVGTARRLGGTVSHWREHWRRNAASTIDGWIGVLAPALPEDRVLRAVMIAHEFVHTTQQAATNRAAARPPMWFIEGGAQWLGLEIARTMPFDPRALDHIEASWRAAGTERGLSLGTSTEDRAAYDLGAIAAKSLAGMAGDQALISTFRHLSAGLSWPRAFRRAFDVRLSDFLHEFERGRWGT